MEQLKMIWHNDNTPPQPVAVPAGCAIVPFSQLGGALDAWLDIVQYGLSDGRKDAAYYQSTMEARPHYDPDFCYILLESGQPAATLTLIFDPETRDGYVHMVACKESYRGKGYGTLLTRFALYRLKRAGMRTARLTTDDWRLPAIRSYLRIGFAPVHASPEVSARWDAVMEKAGLAVQSPLENGVE